MPLSIPAFDQYQSPMFPLRGLWNAVPPEGDKFVNAEIDWLVTTKSQAVQFSLSGNSPVSLSQIVALCVDNSRSGADVSFIFPDSGFELVVPAHNQVISPVFTNALMFYANAPNSKSGDITILQILNSMPPPIPIAPSITQNTASVAAIPMQTNGSTQVVPAGTNGTLNSFTISVQATAAGVCTITLIDGAGKTLWLTAIDVAGASTLNFPVSGLSTRFTNGLSLQIASTTFTAGFGVVNCYYSTP